MTCILSILFDEHWDVSSVGKSLSLLRLIRCWILRASLFMSVEFASNILELSLSTDLLRCKCVELICPLFWVFRPSKKKAPSNQNKGQFDFPVSNNKVYIFWKLYNVLIYHMIHMIYDVYIYIGYTVIKLYRWILRSNMATKKNTWSFVPFSGQQWSSICCGSFWASPWSQLRNAPP